MSIQEHTWGDGQTPSSAEAWPGWAAAVELPASLEYALLDAEAPPSPVSAPLPPEEPAAAALRELLGCLEQARAERSAAQVAREEAEAIAQAAHLEVARLAAELAAERARVSQLERDRDDVIRRAEDLVTAVRERADQRLASELEADRRHWRDVVAEERRRVEVLEGERTALVRQLQEAWQSTGAVRRARPLRPAAEAAEPVVNSEPALVPAGASPDGRDTAEDIERLRSRLRAQLHRPPPLADVEEGVDQLRESRLARDAEGRRRRK